MFYDELLLRLINDKTLHVNDSVLVVCGATLDYESLRSKGFQDVTITNLDKRTEGQISTYKWEYQDAENLTYDDNSFDMVVVHAGLHHCHSPHGALLEMFRVARKAVLVFEARDSFLMKTAIRLGLTIDYEIEAISGDDDLIGGVAGGPVPNYVYRWTEREVRKTIASFDPARQHSIDFYYYLRLPHQRLKCSNRKLLGMIAWTIEPGLRLVTKLLPKQCNEFAFLIRKTQTLQPWLVEKSGVLGVNLEWGDQEQARVKSLVA